jgi:hypothetical protein
LLTANKSTKEVNEASDTAKPGIGVEDNLNQHVARTSSGRIVNKASRFLGITNGLDPDFKELEARKQLMVS